jgi:flagellar basal-body rod protein FlgC
MRVLLMLAILLFSLSYSDVFDVIHTSQSAMKVQQKKLNVIAENIANISTTKTKDGDDYYQKSVIIKTDKKTNHPYVAAIQDRPTTVMKIYDPTNPEADENGYVYEADNSLSNELVDMAMTRRLYDANAAVFNSAKSVAQTLMNLGK